MQDNPLVSVIIPIYNVEAYVAQCLDSIINQSYTHLEIICVNDGSTDSSGVIVQEYAQRDCRICYLEQENKGQSAARNTGLDIAKGEWICFIDSDDYVDLTWIEELVKHSAQESVVINFNVLFEFDDKAQRFNTHKTLKGSVLLSPKNITLFDFFVANCLLPKSLIDLYQVRFIEGKICEDAGFLYQILPFAKTIECIDLSAYHYRQRIDSTTGKLALCNEVTFDRIFMFIFLTHWYVAHSLVYKCGLPFHLLYEIYTFHHNAQDFYKKAKEVIGELSIKKEVWQRDKLMTLFMRTKCALRFIRIRDVMQNTQERNFRIRLFKEYSVIRLFGRTLYEHFKV
ncbi:glycosyltransferase family 2 protein [Helicobacter sp. MIT 21-1697]|uniref:glycosyltransferase family 2 protein n=1 Tax=Helicobacter sp. MIT 21-1697 TaxID=2993733 RepID=UPI00224AAEEB|nr:glycosyltransferase family 2 protein [Helicobacter sp. MIT 21-1697]MCX2717302.1 glycosyltransferase family 2 protein [Helicobacter sp. MIT 21-1697]